MEGEEEEEGGKVGASHSRGRLGVRRRDTLIITITLTLQDTPESPIYQDEHSQQHIDVNIYRAHTHTHVQREETEGNRQTCRL